MKKMKTLCTLLLALVLVLSMSITALAAGEGGSIKLNNALAGETYNLYKVLDLSYDADKNAYAYTLPADSEWESFFKNEGAAWFSFDEASRLVTTTLTDESPAVYDMAQAMMAYAKANNVTAVKTVTPEAAGSVTFDGLTEGYYLIDTTTASVCILDSNVTNLELNAKSPTPTLTKQVAEQSTQGELNWGIENTVSTLQAVYYRLNISNLARLNKVVVHDVMAPGLIFQNDIAITTLTKAAAAAELPDTLVEGTHYTVEAPVTCEHGCDFHIVFSKDNFLSVVSNSDTFQITYSARLGTTADVSQVVIGSEGNKNTAFLTYGEAQKTPDQTVTTRTYSANLYKYWNDPSTTEIPKDDLAGAQFELHMSRTGDANAFVTSVDENGIINGWAYNLDDGTTLPAGAKPYRFTSDAKGMITVNGLDADTYQWIEVVAPEGFNLLTEGVKFSIDQNGDMYNSTGTIANIIEVQNKTGNELPETGGFGTTLLVTVGMLGIVIFGVLMVTNKRMKKEGF